MSTTRPGWKGAVFLACLVTVASTQFADFQVDPARNTGPTNAARVLLGSAGDHRMDPFLLDLAAKELAELREGPVLQLLVTANELASQQLGTNRFKHVRRVLQELLSTLSEMSSTSYNGSYPVTRRVVLGMVLSAQRSFTSVNARNIAELVDNIHFEFYRLHREAARHKGIVQFHHISKNAGTSMCLVAKKAGCTTQNFAMSWNCRIKEFGDTPVWTVKGFPDPNTGETHHPFFSRGWPHRPANDQLDSCIQRAKYLKQAGYNFFANELYLVNGLRSPVSSTPCDNFLNTIILRRPVPRMLSNLKHIAAYYINMKASPPQGLAALNDTAPAVLDNYSIRMLLGHWIYDLKLGGIHGAHLELAKLKLQQFDAVMLLESPDELHVLMRYVMGWNTTLRDVSKINTGNHGSSNNQLQLTDNDMQTLALLNKYDNELYDFAHRIMSIDLAWVQAALKVAKVRDPSFISHAPPGRCGYVDVSHAQR